MRDETQCVSEIDRWIQVQIILTKIRGTPLRIGPTHAVVPRIQIQRGHAIGSRPLISWAVMCYWGHAAKLFNGNQSWRQHFAFSICMTGYNHWCPLTIMIGVLIDTWSSPNIDGTFISGHETNANSQYGPYESYTLPGHATGGFYDPKSTVHLHNTRSVHTCVVLPNLPRVLWWLDVLWTVNSIWKEITKSVELNRKSTTYFVMLSRYHWFVS